MPIIPLSRKAPRAAQVSVIGNAELAHRRGEFTDPIATKLIGLITRQLAERGHEDLAFLTQGARQQRDASPPAPRSTPSSRRS